MTNFHSSHSTSTALPTILLYGPSGTGKTSSGKLLAEALELPFHDLDIEIETGSGRKIPDIFATDGEASFREFERAGLERLLAGGGVISLGGGALTHPPTRALADAHGCRVLVLKADPSVIVARLQADTGNPRPLLQGDPHAKLAAMLERRGPHYAGFHYQLDTTRLTPAETAWQAQITLGIFHVAGMGRAYDVRVGTGLLDMLGNEMQARKLRGPVALVSDEITGAWYADRAAASLAAAGYEAHTILIPAGESHKTIATVQALWAGFQKAGIERGSTVVALGGGVVGDLAGFAAARWMRGVPWVNVPTTLLAMCDSSLGGKTGADLPEGKNLVGAFHPPALVLADPGVLATLPESERCNGMAEVLKHGIIADPDLFDVCLAAGFEQSALSEIVRRSMAVKIQVIQQDPYEKGLRQALNLGHTIGHAVELASNFRLRHGEAVAIGLVAEARLAEKLGIADRKESLAMRIIHALQQLRLPTEIPPDLDPSTLRRVMQSDKKKTSGKVLFALPVRIGEVRVGVEADEKEWL